MLTPDFSIKLRVGMAVFLAAMVPLFVLSTLSLSALTAGLQNALARELAAQREAILAQLETRIDLLSHSLASERVPRNRQEAEASLRPAVEHYWSTPNLLEALYLFGPDFEYWAGRNQTGAVTEAQVPSDLRVKLQSVLFSRSLMIRDIGLESSEARVVLLRKSGSGGESRYWAAVLSPELWRPSPTLSGGLEVSLLNSHFQVLYDNRERIKPSSVQINPLSQRQLQGFSEVRAWDDRVWGTGSLDLKDTAVFLAISPRSDPLQGPTTQLFITIAFVGVLTALLAALAALTLSRAVVRFGEQVLARNHFSKEMGFFVRLEKTLSELAGRVGDVNRLASDLNYLRNDLSVLREMMPGEPKIEPTQE